MTDFRAFLLILTLFLVNIGSAYSQKQAKAVCIAFYNVENLFDTIDDPATNDIEFTPSGGNQWTWDRYQEKLSHMSFVINQIGEEVLKGGPTLIGLSEVENRGVLEDLIKTDALRNSGYAVAHFDSPDRRGVDVGLLYKKKDFTIINAASVRMIMPGQPDFKTRDQLVVTGLIDNDTISVLVNHWPSRGNDEPYRLAAAAASRKIADSLYQRNKDANILIMGDLNDDPVDPSVSTILGAEGRLAKVKPGGLYNPMWKMFKDGIGSLAYKDSWNLFDQIIVSEPLTREKTPGWKLYKTRVFNKPFLIQKDGQYAGYPFRTFAGGAYTAGYSDHLPVYVILVKEK
jgi:predicted extracellular nuclease